MSSSHVVELDLARARITARASNDSKRRCLRAAKILINPYPTAQTSVRLKWILDLQ